jgi:hypothetical protein
LNNNNRNNNNRRRGRGGNRQQGGGQQVNRIDSRARGNAPQMLEKYRKLAHDAHLNGDRVQEEYFLQFADHYFRVIADQRQRQEEQRAPRREWQEGDQPYREDSEDGGEFSNETEFQSYERQTFNREEREPREAREPREPREPRQPREDRGESRPPREQREDFATGEPSVEEPVAETPSDPAAIFEPAENPFVRGSRGLRPRREPRPRPESKADDDAPLGLDPASLPPAISAGRDTDESGDDGDAPAAEAAPRRRTRRTRPPSDDAGETLEVAS